MPINFQYRIFSFGVCGLTIPRDEKKSVGLPKWSGSRGSSFSYKSGNRILWICYPSTGL